METVQRGLGPQLLAVDVLSLAGGRAVLRLVGELAAMAPTGRGGAL